MTQITDSAASSLLPRLVAIKDLRPDDKNPRRITRDRFENLARRIMADPEFLWQRPVLAYADGLIYAGSQRDRVVAWLWEGKRPKAKAGESLPDWPMVARAAGIEPNTVPAVLQDVDERIARERAIVDNLHWGEFDEEMLHESMSVLADLGSTIDTLGLAETELTNLMAGDGLEGGAGLNTLIDEAEQSEDEAPPKHPITRPGDLWIMGEHRLICGDSTDPDVIDRLMGEVEIAELGLTDPPYNVDEDYATAEDSRTDEEYTKFCGAFYKNLAAHTARQIITPGTLNLWTWMRLPEASRNRDTGVWLRTNSMVRGTVSKFVTWDAILFYGDGFGRERASNVFDYPVTVQQAEGIGTLTDLHPCPKPLRLWVDIVEHYTDRGQIVVDTFGGTGTTLIACEGTKRIAYLCELDLGYCDLIVKRWTSLTGGDAIRQDGGSFRELSAQQALAQ